MKETLFHKILKQHIINEDSENYYIHIDQTLTQDATGTMAYLELMSMPIDKVQTELSVSYVDHNTLQNGYENADDHAFLQSVAAKYGIYFSRAGNGICHQVHLERFSKPSKTLLGSDSHTPTSGALGMIAIGAGGLDVALAMAGKPFKMVKPKVVKVILNGTLQHGVASKDIILEVLRRCSVKGGVNKVFEYTGDGIKSLSVFERATICNMGAELGATTSLFPSDSITLAFLKKQGREQDYVALTADEDALYDEQLTINLSALTPLMACPNQPDNVIEVASLQGLKVNQVCIGSCTNSSYEDMVKVASILKGKKIAPHVSLTINPGSKQVLTMMIQNGLLEAIISSGARLLECTCGPCIGMGQSPSSEAVSLRTYNRNFLGRSGTMSAKVYLVSPETAAISAIKGEVALLPSSQSLKEYPMLDHYSIDDSMILKPTGEDHIVMGPNIHPLPTFEPLKRKITAPILLKMEDNISTDHIMMAGAKVLPYRSNIEKLSDYCFYPLDPTFKKRAIETKEAILLAGNNYGQGSSREHAAICPRYLHVKVILAKSFARIHRQNLINFGIVPLCIEDFIYQKLSQGDEITIQLDGLFEEGKEITLHHQLESYSIPFTFSKEEKEMLQKGSLLNTL